MRQSSHFKTKEQILKKPCTGRIQDFLMLEIRRIELLTYALPAPSFNPQTLTAAPEEKRQSYKNRCCIGMAVTPCEKQLIRQDYYIAVGKIYRADLGAIKR